VELCLQAKAWTVVCGMVCLSTRPCFFGIDLDPISGKVRQQLEMCSGSEAGSYLRRIDVVYHSTLGLRVIKKKEGTT